MGWGVSVGGWGGGGGVGGVGVSVWGAKVSVSGVGKRVLVGWGVHPCMITMNSTLYPLTFIELYHTAVCLVCKHLPHPLFLLSFIIYTFPQFCPPLPLSPSSLSPLPDAPLSGR